MWNLGVALIKLGFSLMALMIALPILAFFLVVAWAIISTALGGA